GRNLKMGRRSEDAEPGSPPLANACILIVEDDYFIATELESILIEAGARMLPLCRTSKEALAVLENGAVSLAGLDFRLVSETSESVARRLQELKAPFVFYTGQIDAEKLLAAWPGCRVLSKPARPAQLVQMLADLSAASNTSAPRVAASASLRRS